MDLALAIGILIGAILLVLLVNESGLDGTTARVLRIVIIGAALIFFCVKFLPAY